MFDFFSVESNQFFIDIYFFDKGAIGSLHLSAFEKNWLQSAHIEENTLFKCPDPQGILNKVFLHHTQNDYIDLMSECVLALPDGVYRLQGVNAEQYARCALYWAMSAYQFTQYKVSNKKMPVLYLPDEIDQAQLFAEVTGIFLARDLINTPTEGMNTDHFAAKAKSIAKEQGAEYSVIKGEVLKEKNYPAIYTVGRASAFPPQLVKMLWGKKEHPKLTLVGKGVCFDSGGLNIKTGHGMTLMKKDMGGAAHALSLANMIMQLNLPIYLQVYLPLVENAISSNAYRPGDVLQTRQGLTVEVGNTDAEGRLILADALTAACEESPDLLIDFATLTGAARVALGTDLPAFFSRDEALAKRLQSLSEEEGDCIWQLPLHAPYRRLIDSPIADLTNSAKTPYAGAITAALFLNEFVSPEINWLHFDLMAWNVSTRSGHPEGGEAQGLFTLLAYLKQDFINH